VELVMKYFRDEIQKNDGIKVERKGTSILHLNARSENPIELSRVAMQDCS
jgi:hypothetical protein